ncbi:DUF58 domain-containing protein [Gryllotalpicola ginsengisoli]|uniref:DUF58 domain-containing protein n=1 Tax=Gryllotalpicola ginsengisoli TaxID=444608 RepID=UPI0003B2F7B6|nr:DUF58 domain-containing protein [Gryllotalpicola ginsengisoli]
MRGPIPTLRGWAVGICGLGMLFLAGWFARVDLLFAGVLLTVAPLAAMIAIALDRPWLTVHRSYAPDVVAAGDETQVRLEVRNQSARPTPALRWVDRVPAEIAQGPERSLPSLAGRSAGRGGRSDTAVLRYAARTRRRGRYLLGPMQVVRTDPFGLAQTGYAVGDPRALTVTPRVFALEPGGPDEARGEGAEHELVRHSIPSADEVIARDYRAGDPLRRVHWRATARQDRLMVRQEEQRSNPQAWIALDTVRERGLLDLALTARQPGEPFERAVELAASIAVHLLRLGYLVGVIETGERQLSGSYEQPGGDRALIGQLSGLDQVAEATADHVGLLTAAVRRSSTGTPVFLILVDGPGPAEWAEPAAIVAAADPAVAFLATPEAQAARPALEAAGWLCVDIDGRTDARGAWSAATAAHQARRSLRLDGTTGRV